MAALSIKIYCAISFWGRGNFFWGGGGDGRNPRSPSLYKTLVGNDPYGWCISFMQGCNGVAAALGNNRERVKHQVQSKMCSSKYTVSVTSYYSCILLNVFKIKLDKLKKLYVDRASKTIPQIMLMS